MEIVVCCKLFLWYYYQSNNSLDGIGHFCIYYFYCAYKLDLECNSEPRQYICFIETVVLRANDVRNTHMLPNNCFWRTITSSRVFNLMSSFLNTIEEMSTRAAATIYNYNTIYHCLTPKNINRNRTNSFATVRKYFSLSHFIMCVLVIYCETVI